MSSTSTIEWTSATWNPVTGCTEVSPGCDHCYARTFAERFRGVPGHPYEQGFDLKLWPDRLKLPLKWRKPRRIFVNSMSDLFHKDVPDDYILQCFETMIKADQHTFQLLTKRPGRLADSFILRTKLKERFLQLTGSPSWPAHIWYGVSVESDDYRWRIAKAVILQAPTTFISAEPLLEELNLIPSPGGYCLQDIAWVITGAESGHGARPMNEDWVRSLRDQCQWSGTKFFYKQKLVNGKKVPLPELDGRTWDEFPAAREEAVR